MLKLVSAQEVKENINRLQQRPSAEEVSQYAADNLSSTDKITKLTQQERFFVLNACKTHQGTATLGEQVAFQKSESGVWEEIQDAQCRDVPDPNIPEQIRRGFQNQFFGRLGSLELETAVKSLPAQSRPTLPPFRLSKERQRPSKRMPTQSNVRSSHQPARWKIKPFIPSDSSLVRLKPTPEKKGSSSFMARFFGCSGPRKKQQELWELRRLKVPEVRYSVGRRGF